MSLGYAEKLSYRSDLGGQLGAEELFDAADELQAKIAELAELVDAAKSVVVFTGAGISTACGIPDFRGPAGVWTLQRAGKPLPKPKCSFTVAQPSLTHMALAALVLCGKVRLIVSQNVDGMHLRSGVPRRQLAELHGNCFAERCPKCGTEYIRDFEIETVGFKPTGRTCSAEGCRGRLKDHILDWEDALPEDDLRASEEAASQADLAICLGTSLQITPACNLPLRTPRAGGKLVIVNLQATPKDKKAHLVIHARADEVMRAVMARLRMRVPAYVREDRVVLSHCLEAPAAKGFAFSLCVSSVHGRACPMPLVDRVEVAFQDEAALRPGMLRSVPFQIRRTAAGAGPCHVSITLHLVDAIAEHRRMVKLQHIVHILSREEYAVLAQSNGRGGSGARKRKRASAAAEHSRVISFTTQEVCYDQD